MVEEFEFRLLTGPSATGEISIRHLNALTEPLQTLATRIAREVAGDADVGRPSSRTSEVAEIRLRGVGAGSTVLRLVRRPSDQLALDLDDQREVDHRFWDAIESMGRDVRPSWMSDSVAESAGNFVRAIKANAPRCSLGNRSRGTVIFEDERLHTETWRASDVSTETDTAATGRLEKVDLHAHTFRLRDDVGNTVVLRRVRDDASAAKLVGSWVRARGTAVTRPNGRLDLLEDVSIETAADPGSLYLYETSPTLKEYVAALPGPDPDGGIEFTDDEFSEFLRAARS